MIAVTGAAAHLGWRSAHEGNNVVVGQALALYAKIVDRVAKAMFGRKHVSLDG
jgi:hypothetical protein